MEIPESAVWYLRGAVGRGLHSTQKDIEMLNAFVNNPETPETFKIQAGNLRDYNEQWLREARAEFKAIDEFRNVLGVNE